VVGVGRVIGDEGDTRAGHGSAGIHRQAAAAGKDFGCTGVVSCHRAGDGQRAGVVQRERAAAGERAEVGDGVVLVQGDTTRGVASQREGVDASAVSLRHRAGDGVGGRAYDHSATCRPGAIAGGGGVDVAQRRRVGVLQGDRRA
jgi:hypothetical protein